MTEIRSSREFNQDTGRAERDALNGPVYITDRGRPSHVLLSFDDYRRLVDERRSLAERLGRPEGIGEVEFTPPRSTDTARPAAFDAEASLRAASLHVPDPAPFRDGLIAATALVNAMSVVTRNRRDFENRGLLGVIDPWD